MREIINTNGRLFDCQFLSEPIPLPQFKSATGGKVFYPQNGASRLLLVSSSSLALESLKPHMQLPIKKTLIHLLNGHLKYFLFRNFIQRSSPSINKTVDSTFVLKGPIDQLRDIGVWNLYGGYSYLIDRDSNIIWKGSGGMTSLEFEEIKNYITRNF